MAGFHVISGDVRIDKIRGGVDTLAGCLPPGLAHGYLTLPARCAVLIER